MGLELNNYFAWKKPFGQAAQGTMHCLFCSLLLFFNFSRTRLVSVGGSAKPCYGCGVPGDRSYHRGFAKNPIVAWCSAVS